MDRVLGTRLGYESVIGLMEGKTKFMAGQVAGKVVFTPLTKAVKHLADINQTILSIAEIMSY
jgi:6-phosphofructokinase 1